MSEEQKIFYNFLLTSKKTLEELLYDGETDIDETRLVLLQELNKQIKILENGR